MLYVLNRIHQLSSKKPAHSRKYKVFIDTQKKIPLSTLNKQFNDQCSCSCIDNVCFYLREGNFKVKTLRVAVTSRKQFTLSAVVLLHDNFVQSTAFTNIYRRSNIIRNLFEKHCNIDIYNTDIDQKLHTVHLICAVFLFQKTITIFPKILHVLYEYSLQI